MVIVLVLVALAVAALPIPELPAPRPRPRGDHDLVALCEMTALGVSSGLSFGLAASAAASEVGGRVGSDAALRVRRGAMVDRRGPTARLFAMAASAAASGAPLLPMIDGYLTELRAEERAARLERVRKLPVKLLFPLALLLLPGFLLLTVGPVVSGSLRRLGL